MEWEEEERRRGQEHLNAILDQSGHILEVQLHDRARDSRSRSRSVSTHGRDRTPVGSDDDGTRDEDDDDEGAVQEPDEDEEKQFEEENEEKIRAKLMNKPKTQGVGICLTRPHLCCQLTVDLM